MSSKAWKGQNNLDDARRPLAITPWDEVWITPWDTDAHFVTYEAVNTGQDRWPRCNKAILPKLRAVGGDLVTRLIVLDYDNPGHEAWSQASFDEWLAKLAEAADQEPIAWQWALLYTTRHGARLVYVLDEPVPVDESEKHHRWVCQALRDVGITIDDINSKGYHTNGEPAKVLFPTSDWTRCFRLPFVMRDGLPTWEDPISEFIEQPGQTLEVHTLGQLETKKKTPKARVEERDDPKPDPEAALALLEEQNESTGRWVQSHWLKEAKKRLKGRECYDCLFKHQPLADVGARDSTIMRYVGEATTLLYRISFEGGERMTTPEHVYGLFLDPVLQLDPDDDTSDWTDVLWRHVLYCWVREDAEERQREIEREAREADQLTQLDMIVEGMRQWCQDSRLHGPEEEAREFVFGHLIAAVDRTCHVMKLNGRYDSMGVAPHLLIPRIRVLGMSDLIETKVPNAKGDGWRMLSAQEILNEHATAVDRISGIPARDGAWISKIDQDDAILHVPIYHRRTDLIPTYSKEVAEWLKAFFGEYYEEACNWIAHALAVEDGPICAMSIRGEQGAGKKMIAQGLAEAFNNEHCASAQELVGQFQPGLLSTPLLLVDEGWPSRGSGGKHPADMFRELVGGGKRWIDRKFRAPVECTNPVRVLLTANNLDVVRVLFTGRDMSPEDRNAIALRILHYDIGDTASKYLRRLGGSKHTRGWIAGDGGEPSRYVVAKHFLWLYENKRKPRGQRLLVEGNGHSSLMDEMRTQSGSAPFVIEALVKMIERKSQTFDGLTVEEGKLYVLTSEVLEYFRSYLSKSTSERLTAARIGQVFKGLITSPTHLKKLKSRESMGRRRWHEIDLVVLRKVARDTGWPCTQLDALVAEQIKRGIISGE